MRAVVGFWAADRVGGSGVDTELKTQDRVPSAILVKAVPPLLDDSTNLGINTRVDILAVAETRQ
jgi:hypothetical protein